MNHRRGRGRSQAATSALAAVVLVVVTAGVASGASDRVRPDDPMFEDHWALENTGQSYGWVKGTPGADIDATRAWSLTTGSRSVVVAILDRSFDPTEEDLAANTWANPRGVNGCPVGSHGLDEASGACEPDPSDGIHGTVMGWTIGAVGDNGTGMAGVNWATALMGVTIEPEATSVAAGIEWIIDAREAGANVRVINASFGTWFGDDARVGSAIHRAGEAGILFVTAAGNTGEDADTHPRYPCNFDLPNLICVAASDHNDDLAAGSSYGATTVHLAAPGRDLCNSPYYKDCTSGSSTSTSDAAAYVSGVAALVWSYRPGLTPEEVRSKILGNVDVRAGLEGRVATGGRLNAYQALTGPPSWPADDRADDGTGTNDGADDPIDGGSGSSDDGGTGGGSAPSGTSPEGADDGDGDARAPSEDGSATSTPDTDRTRRPASPQEAAGSEPEPGPGATDVAATEAGSAPEPGAPPTETGPTGPSPDPDGPSTALGDGSDGTEDRGPSGLLLVLAMLLAGRLFGARVRKSAPAALDEQA